MIFRMCSLSICSFPFPSAIVFFDILLYLLSAGLQSVPTGSPVVMSAAQCVMLARSAARAERTETQKETKNLAKREYFLKFLLRFVWYLLFLRLLGV